MSRRRTALVIVVVLLVELLGGYALGSRAASAPGDPVGPPVTICDEQRCYEGQWREGPWQPPAAEPVIVQPRFAG